MDRERIALQMYSVRELAAADFLGTLRAVAAAGFGAVEFAGFFDTHPARLRAVLDEAGLVPASSHVALETLEQDTQNILNWHQELGIRDLVVPWIAPQLRTDAGGWQSVARRLSAMGSRLNDAGFRLAYHHHDFEFLPAGPSTGLTILMDACDPDLVGLQVDTYWAAFSGADPAALIQYYANRMNSVHLKDMDSTPDRAMTEVGTGTLDFSAILTAAACSTVRWLIIEHDAPRLPPLDSARVSLRNLRALLA